MDKRIYVVETPAGQVLVEATSQAQAVNTVVSGLYKARIAKPKEIVEMMQTGTKWADNDKIIASA
jgi:hypothetical protein